MLRTTDLPRISLPLMSENSTGSDKFEVHAMTELSNLDLKVPLTLRADHKSDNLTLTLDQDFVAELLMSIETMDPSEVEAALDQFGVDLEVSAAEAAAVFYDEHLSCIKQQYVDYNLIESASMSTSYTIYVAGSYHMDTIIRSCGYEDFMCQSWRAIDHLVENEKMICKSFATTNNKIVAITPDPIKPPTWDITLVDEHKTKSSFQELIDKLWQANRSQPCHIDPSILKFMEQRTGEEQN